ncbi:MAG: hypothetical protein QXY05_03510 [Candidatus Anstonellales archaeon]
MRKFSFVLIAFLLLISSGCIRERKVEIGEYEKIYAVSVEDIDNDGIADVRYYKFSPYVVEEEGAKITFTRILIASPKEAETTVYAVNDLSEQDTNEMQSLMLSFSANKQESELRCKQNIGIGTGSCTSVETCSDICTSPACGKYKEYAKEPLGYSIYSFYSEINELNNLITEVENSLLTLNTASKTQKASVLQKLDRILVLTMEINANPLMDKNAFGICTPINYDTEKIRQIMRRVGNSTRTITSYEYTILLQVDSEEKGAYVETYVKDRLPNVLSSSMIKLNLFQGGNVYEHAPVKIVWPVIKSSTYPKYFLLYSVIATLEPREDVFSRWSTPDITIRVISLETVPFFREAADITKNVFSKTVQYGYYIALATSIAFWSVLSLILIQILKSLLSIVFAITDKKDILKEFKRSLGEANVYWGRYVLGAVLLLGAGYTLQHYVAKPVAEQELVFSATIEYLGKDFGGFLAFITFFLGVNLLYIVIEDKIKGIVGGKEYYKSIIELSPQANALKLKKLKELMEELRHEINVYNEKKIDTTKEYDLLISVPLERLEKMIAENEDQRAVRDIIKAYTEKIEDAKAGLKEKEEISKESWPRWEAYILSLLEESDAVALDSMISIPQAWRVWAANRFVEEHPEEGVALEGEVLQRSVKGPEGMAQSLISAMVRKGIASGGIIVKDGKLLGGHFAKGKANVLKILMLKLLSEMESLVKESFGEEIEKVECLGKKENAFLVKEGNATALIIVPHGKMNEAKEMLKKKLGRI